MFSSNQVFTVSCDDTQLETVLCTAISMHETGNVERFLKTAVYQTTDRKIALGWCSSEPANGWNKFPLGAPTMEMVLALVRQFCKEHPVRGEHFWDGSYRQGYIIKAIPEDMGDKNEDGVKSPFYGIFTIEAYENFYSK